MALDRITLITPSKSEYAKTVRMTAATLGSRLGMSFDGVDDLKMAAEEAFTSALGFLGEDGEVPLQFTIDADEIRIDVSVGDSDISEGLNELSDLILNEVCDEHGLVPDEHGGSVLYVVKRVEAVDVD